MANTEIVKIAGLRLRLEGETEFQEGLRRAGHELKTNANEFRLINERMKNAGGSAQDYQIKIKALTKQMDAQREKIKVLNDLHAKTKEQYGENSRESDKLAERIQTEEIRYEKLVNKLSRAEEEMQKFAKSSAGLRETLRETNPELAEFQDQAEAFSKNMKESAGKWQQSGEKIKSIGRTLSTHLTLPITAIGTASVAAYKEYETAFTGVRKTVDASEEQFTALSDAIRAMSTEIPFSAAEIAGIAKIAGQLGIETDNILSFSRVILDLSAATNILGEEGTRQLAQFANATGMAQTDFDRLGSAIVDLGNNSATTEKDILNMAERLGGLGSTANLSEAEILGIATAMASVGINAEAGGSAMSQFILKMVEAAERGGDELEAFAEIAGVTTTEFKKLFETDPAGALNAVIEGMRRTKEEGGSMVDLLDLLNIKNIRQRDMLLRLAGSTNSMAHYIDLSNNAWEENTALAEEAGAAYETTNNQLVLSKNKIKEAAIELGGHLAPVVADVFDDFAETVEKFADLPPSVQETIVKIGVLAAALGPVISGFGTLITSIGTIQKTLGGIAGALASDKFAKFATAINTFVHTPIGEAATAAGKLLIAWKGLEALWKYMSGPNKKTIKAINSVRDGMEDSVKASKKLKDSFAKNAQAAKPLISKISELEEVEELSVEQKAMMKALVDELNLLYPELGLQIDEYSGKLNMTTEALEDYIQAEKKRIEAQTYQDEYHAAIQAQVEAQRLYDEATAEFDRLTSKEKKKFLFVEYEGSVGNSLEVNKAAKDQIETKKLLDEATENLSEAESKYVDIVKDSINIQEKSTESTQELTEQKEQSAQEQEVIQKRQLESFRVSADEFKEIAQQWNKSSYDRAVEATGLLEGVLESIDLTTEEATKLFKDHYNAIEERAQQNLQSMGSIQDEGIAKLDLTADDIRRNLEQQISDFNDWQDQIADISKRVPPAVAEQLKQLGPEARDYIAELNRMSAEELDGHVQTWESKMNLARESALEELGPIPDDVLQLLKSVGVTINENGYLVIDEARSTAANAVSQAKEEASGFYDVGRNISLGMASGVRAGAAQLVAEARNAIANAKAAAKHAAYISSPSKAFRDEVGVMLSRGMALGVKKEAPAISKEVIGSIQRAIDVSKLMKKFFREAGEANAKAYLKGFGAASNAVSGLTSGMINQQLFILKRHHKYAELEGKRFYEAFARGISSAEKELEKKKSQKTQKKVDKLRDKTPARYSEKGISKLEKSLPDIVPPAENGNIETPLPYAALAPSKIVIENMTVREQEDIRKVANQIWRFEERRLKSVGRMPIVRRKWNFNVKG